MKAWLALAATHGCHCWGQGHPWDQQGQILSQPHSRALLPCMTAFASFSWCGASCWISSRMHWALAHPCEAEPEHCPGQWSAVCVRSLSPRLTCDWGHQTPTPPTSFLYAIAAKSHSPCGIIGVMCYFDMPPVPIGRHGRRVAVNRSHRVVTNRCLRLLCTSWSYTSCKSPLYGALYIMQDNMGSFRLKADVQKMLNNEAPQLQSTGAGWAHRSCQA